MGGLGILGGMALAAFLLGRNAEPTSPCVLTERDLDSFELPVTCERSLDESVLNRFYCEPEAREGPWGTPDAFDDSFAARENLSLPSMNCGSSSVEMRVREGAPNCSGRVAPAFGHSGGGRQVLVRNPQFVEFR